MPVLVSGVDNGTDHGTDHGTGAGINPPLVYRATGQDVAQEMEIN